MPFDSYTDLIESVQNWLEQPDLDDEVQDFIRLAEIEIQRKLKWRFVDTETTGNFVADQDYISLPTDCIEPRFLRIDMASKTWVDIVGPKDFVKYGERFAGLSYPLVAMSQGLKLKLSPTPATTHAYTLWYQAGIPMLADDNTTNWILQNAFDALLHGALWHGFAFDEDYDKANYYEGKFNQAIPDLRASEMRARTGGGPLRVRTDVDAGGCPWRK